MKPNVQVSALSITRNTSKVIGYLVACVSVSPMISFAILTGCNSEAGTKISTPKSAPTSVSPVPRVLAPSDETASNPPPDSHDVVPINPPVSPPVDPPANPPVAGPTDPGTPILVSDFAKVQAILVKNCVSCHAKFKVNTEAELLALKSRTGAPLVVAQHSGVSPLYTELQGAGFGGKMPKRAAPLSAEDLAVIRTWIDGLPPLSPAVDLGGLPNDL